MAATFKSAAEVRLPRIADVTRYPCPEIVPQRSALSMPRIAIGPCSICEHGVGLDPLPDAVKQGFDQKEVNR
jgi:hypothetical protein